MSETSARVEANEQPIADESPRAAGLEETASNEDEIDTVLAEVPVDQAAAANDERPETPAATANVDEGLRQAAAERVRAATSLPAGIRERLAALAAAGAEASADGRTLVALDDAIRALDESLPGVLRLTGNDVARVEHPQGAGFFRTTPSGELTEDEAEAVARAQLARSGLLRGQRARAAQD